MGEQQYLKAWDGLKDPGLDATSFTANGNEYVIAPSISVQRWEEYEILGVEIGLGRTFEHIHDQHVKLLGLLNRMAQKDAVLGDMAVILNDLVTGGMIQQAREIHPALKMCALFMNRKGEDTRTITEEMIAEKVADWRAEGMAMTYFFRFAFRSIPGFVTAYKASFPGTSARTEGNEKSSGSPDTKGSSSALDTITQGPSSNA